ncbi:hypothetical protein HNV11_16985 [Spirosoma taeanense]|uniref:Uncharacterized protein n=1 Tax=Spirosoma taeanense TaxID=2735870 RepID=A0A6M5YCE2_9BACT|nr:hypothetical protein [Spirosoma taeanense]QJW90950.1 hypothetical protein HNV11_16985 [Spirosoma taeanense]
MMKRYLFLLFLGLAGLPTFGQQMTDYYRLPDQQSQYNRILNRYGGAYTRDRWYVALSGFVRTDRAQLDNSYNGLLGSSRVTKPGIGALVGWTYREQWAIEGGYARMPIHTEARVRNGYFAYSFPYTNDKQGIVLRARRMVLSTSGPWRRSGLWLSAGLWLIPNSGQNKGGFSLASYSYRYRQGEKPDTLRILGQTNVNAAPTGLAEVGAEYNVRLSDKFDMGFAVRKYWGLGSSLTTDVTYKASGRDPQYAQLQGTGSGMSYGVTLRYTYAVRRNLSNALDVQGKGRIKL